MDQPSIEGNLYCPNIDTLAEALTQYGSDRWHESYHRDRNEMETRNATVSRPTFRLAVGDKSSARRATSAGPLEPIPCPLKRQ